MPGDGRTGWAKGRQCSEPAALVGGISGRCLECVGSALLLRQRKFQSRRLCSSHPGLRATKGSRFHPLLWGSVLGPACPGRGEGRGEGRGRQEHQGELEIHVIDVRNAHDPSKDAESDLVLSPTQQVAEKFDSVVMEIFPHTIGVFNKTGLYDLEKWGKPLSVFTGGPLSRVEWVPGWP